MLAVSRLIGHKEYGNTGPPLGGGYPGRKIDPRYSMDDKRRRVAAFKPRGSSAPPLPPEDDVPLTKADQPIIAAAVRDVLFGSDLPETFFYVGEEKHGVGPARVYRFLQHAASHAEKGSVLATAILGELAGLRAAVAELAKQAASGDVSADDLEAAVERGILDAGAALRAISSQPLEAEPDEGAPAT